MRRPIVGISGACGAIYGVRALEVLRGIPEIETHLVITASGRRTIVEETRFEVAEIEALAHLVHEQRDIGASLASGSFRTSGMRIAPCSMKTLSGIARSCNDHLLTRAAG